jgi:hypothetical protein
MPIESQMKEAVQPNHNSNLFLSAQNSRQIKQSQLLALSKTVKNILFSYRPSHALKPLSKPSATNKYS